MADGYSWSEARGGGTYRLPGPEHLGWWAAVAMLVSILLHVAVFFALDRMKIALRFEQTRELSTGTINVRQVEVRPMEEEKAAPPENVIQPPKDAAELMEEIDLLDALPKDLDIDIKPEIKEAEYALQMKNPAIEGDPAAVAMELSSGFEVDADLPELGREPERLKPAEVGQVTVDPGAVQIDDNELGKFTDALIKQGANGKVAYAVYRGDRPVMASLLLAPSLPVIFEEMFGSEIWVALPDRHSLFVFPAKPEALEEFIADLAVRYKDDPHAASPEVFALKKGAEPRVVAAFAK